MDDAAKFLVERRPSDTVGSGEPLILDLRSLAPLVYAAVAGDHLLDAVLDNDRRLSVYVRELSTQLAKAYDLLSADEPAELEQIGDNLSDMEWERAEIRDGHLYLWRWRR